VHWIGRAVLLVASLAVSLGFAEIAVRLVAPQAPSWLAIYRRHPTLPFYALEPDVRVAVDTGESHWVVATDADGHRVASEADGASTVCTNLWLGDSFAFGQGVDYEESLIGRVEAASPQAREVNTAVPGYGPVQYRAVLEDLLARGARFATVTVVTFVGNDFHDGVWNKDVEVRDGVVGNEGNLKSWLKLNVHLYRLVSSVYHRLFPAPDSPYAAIDAELADPAAWKGGVLGDGAAVFEREMRRIQELGRSHGAQVRFVVLPTKAAVEALRARAGADRAAGPLLPVATAERMLVSSGADVLDATPPLAARPREPALYFPYDGHLTSEGNRIVAEAVRARWPMACGDAGVASSR
jgi:hypothetical protein